MALSHIACKASEPWNLSGLVVRFILCSILKMIPVSWCSPSSLKELWHSFPNLSNSKSKTLLWFNNKSRKKKKKRQKAGGLWPRAIKDAGDGAEGWQRIPQNTAKFSSGSLEWAEGLCLYLTYINCHPTAVGAELNTMEHPDGLNKANKCALLLKAVYINFQYFMCWSLYCVTAGVLSSILSSYRVFLSYCCLCVKITFWICLKCMPLNRGVWNRKSVIVC